MLVRIAAAVLLGRLAAATVPFVFWVLASSVFLLHLLGLANGALGVVSPEKRSTETSPLIQRV